MLNLQGTNLYLIGMPGSGKSTIADRLATELHYQVFDTDQLIEQITQQSIAQIFEESGEPVFRQLETRVLSELAGYGRKLVATGGGIVITPENWGYLRTGVIIWLDVPLEVLKERLDADDSRPLLKTEDLKLRLQSLWEARSPLYRQADLHIEIQSSDTPEMICDRILQQLTQAYQEKLDQDAAILKMNETAPFQAR